MLEEEMKVCSENRTSLRKIHASHCVRNFIYKKDEKKIAHAGIQIGIITFNEKRKNYLICVVISFLLQKNQIKFTITNVIIHKTR